MRVSLWTFFACLFVLSSCQERSDQAANQEWTYLPKEARVAIPGRPYRQVYYTAHQGANPGMISKATFEKGPVPWTSVRNELTSKYNSFDFFGLSPDQMPITSTGLLRGTDFTFLCEEENPTVQIVMLNEKTLVWPSHHADLEVALWHQLDTSFIPSEFRNDQTYAYYNDQCELVGGFHLDLTQNLVWTFDNAFLWLPSFAVDRIADIPLEIQNGG